LNGPTGDVITAARAIQQAVAPVFLLTGVGAILGVLTNRLSRVVDRYRDLEERAVIEGHAGHGANTPHPSVAAHQREEMTMLRRRRTWIHRAISACTLCALLVCMVIATLFIATEFGADPSRSVALLFVAAMVSLIGGLLCFLREIALATRSFDAR
jgi:hypothetical protein